VTPEDKFSVDIRAWVKKARGNTDLVVRKISLDMFRKIVLRSPVDTGRFRGNWQIEIGRMPDGVLALDDKRGVATIGKATAKARDIRAGQTVYIVNNLPYGPRLEHGWSRQAPSGMVKITVQEFQEAAKRAAEEARQEGEPIGRK
jgi:hypothetical protein